MRKQTKIAALVSAAALLAIGASMTSFADWVGPLEDGSYEYHDSYGEAVTDEWRTGVSSRDGKTYYYYLDYDGKMATDQLIESGEHLYYVNENGERVSNYWYKVENTEGITVNEIEPANLYYYFDSKGQAVKGDAKGAYATNNDPNNTATSKFCFDDDYHMISGWYTASDGSKYYCSGEDEGYMVTGWAELEVPEEVVDNGEPYEEDSDMAWFYFDSGKMVKGDRKYLSWDGKKYYFEFDSDGCLIEEAWGELSSTAQNATNTLDHYYIDGGYAASGWVEADLDGSADAHSKTWFYFTNGAAYNFNGKDVVAPASANDATNVTSVSKIEKWNEDDGGFKEVDNPNKYAARIIDGKTYLFNEFGEYVTGVYRIDGTVYRRGSSQPLDKGIYYFDLVSGGPKGAMATGKKTVTNQYDVSRNYQFKSDGTAVANAISGGVMYDANGVRVDATDANWAVINAKGYTSDKNEVNLTTKYEFEDGEQVIVGTNGRVRESGTVTIDGRKYFIKTLPTSGTSNGKTIVKTGATVGNSYVIVGYVDID